MWFESAVAPPSIVNWSEEHGKPKTPKGRRRCVQFIARSKSIRALKRRLIEINAISFSGFEELVTMRVTTPDPPTNEWCAEIVGNEFMDSSTVAFDKSWTVGSELHFNSKSRPTWWCPFLMRICTVRFWRTIVILDARYEEVKWTLVKHWHYTKALRIFTFNESSEKNNL